MLLVDIYFIVILLKYHYYMKMIFNMNKSDLKECWICRIEQGLYLSCAFLWHWCICNLLLGHLTILHSCNVMSLCIISVCKKVSVFISSQTSSQNGVYWNTFLCWKVPNTNRNWLLFYCFILCQNQLLWYKFFIQLSLDKTWVLYKIAVLAFMYFIKFFKWI